jgi:cytochrome c553
VRLRPPERRARAAGPLAFGLAAVLLAAALVPAPAQPLSLRERIAQCGTCHGSDGNSQLAHVPSLAGQPDYFLASQLILMREGVRIVPAMQPFVTDLTDAEIDRLAAHYATLEPKPSDEPVDPALVARGAALAAARRCSSCHGPTLSGQQQMPRLAKQRIDYMVAAMTAYLADARGGADTLMTAAIYGLSEADLTALAHYAASQ